MLKRVYEPASLSDGKRVLVDRLWPRGLTKEQARVDRWLRAWLPQTSYAAGFTSGRNTSTPFANGT
ncbi:MAG: DUF488 family protein [Acidobacteriales bacterium]|nr:DUF488 family protein [Terriglobales bacterium]